MIKGLGRFKEIAFYQIIQQSLYLIIAYILLIMDLGIFAVAFSNAITSVVFRFLVVRNVNQLLEEHNTEKERVFSADNSEISEIYEIIKKNTKGLFGATLSTYIASYGSTLVCSVFLPVSTIGKLGLTNQLVGIISTVATVPLSTYANRVGELKISKKWEQVKDIFSVTTVIYCIVYGFGGLTLLLFGQRVLAWYGTNTQMLGVTDTFIIIVTSYIVGLHQRCTTYLMFDNCQPHIKAYFGSSVATVLFSAVALAIYNDVKSYIIISLVIQLLYNGWKWPMQVYYELRLSGADMIKRTYYVIYRTVHKKV